MKKITIVWVILGLALVPLANFAVAQEAGKDATTPALDDTGVVPQGQQQNLSKKEAKKAEKAAKQAQEQAQKAQKEANKKAKKDAENAKEQADKEAKIARKQAEQSQEQAEQARKEALKEEKQALEKAQKQARKVEKQQPKPSRQERRFQQQESRLDAQVSEINRLAQVEGTQAEVYRSMWREHSVSTKRLKKQLESFPNLGAGDLLVANLIARSIHKPLEEVIAANTSGKSWADVAKENNVSVVELIEQTYRVSITGRAVAEGSNKEG